VELPPLKLESSFDNYDDAHQQRIIRHEREDQLLDSLRREAALKQQVAELQEAANKWREGAAFVAASLGDKITCRNGKTHTIQDTCLYCVSESAEAKLAKVWKYLCASALSSNVGGDTEATTEN